MFVMFIVLTVGLFLLILLGVGIFSVVTIAGGIQADRTKQQIEDAKLMKLQSAIALNNERRRKVARDFEVTRSRQAYIDTQTAKRELEIEEKRSKLALKGIHMFDPIKIGEQQENGVERGGEYAYIGGGEYAHIPPEEVKGE